MAGSSFPGSGFKSNSFDGWYYRKPWVQRPYSSEDGDPFAIGNDESQIPVNFGIDEPMNPRDPFTLARPSEWNGPFASNEQKLTQQALMANGLPSRTLQEVVRPNLPQVRLFPPRFGWNEPSQPGIEDVVSIDRTYIEPRVSWFSGGPGGYSGSTRNGLEGV